MKQCLNCSQTFESHSWHCPHCDWTPQVNGNLPVFAPELASQNQGFQASAFPVLASMEACYFWFRVRNDLICWSLKQYGNNFSSLMEIGCGTGFVLKGIARHFPGVRLVGSEIYPDGIFFAAQRLPDCEFLQLDARRIPFVDEFDVVGVFDVIEHIEDDMSVLRQIYQSLKPYGLLLLTVPQHPWLWSKLDENACHVRRYAKQDLIEKLSLSSFQIIRSTSFVTSLLPCIFLSRFLQRGKPGLSAAMAEIQIQPVLNRLFEKILRLELQFIKRGISFPLGGSLLIAARKNPKPKINW